MSSAPPPPRRARPGAPLRHLRVAPKLFVSFGIVCLLLIGVGVTGLIALDNSRRRLDTMYHDSTTAIARLGQVRGDVHSARALAAKLILHSTLSDVSNVETEIKRLDEEIDTAWGQYVGTDGTGREQERAAAETTGAAANTAHAADELSEIALALQKNLAMFRY
jgi:methyl-accepting chemotaxis protein